MLLSILAASVVTQQTSGRAVLDAALSAYGACTTYKDSGEVVSTFDVEGETGDATTRTIKTWFVRPEFVRFECHEIDGETKVDEYFVVWKGKTASHTWWSRLANGTHEPTPIKALRAASAISGGASDLLFPLLVPTDEADVWSLSKLEKPVIGEPATIDGAACHVVSGTGYDGSAVTVWIDAKTHAIRRFRESIAVEGGGRLTDTITLKPQFDTPVTEQDAWFKPPIVKDPPPPGGSTGGGGGR